MQNVDWLSWILSSPAPCELRVCEKWEVGEKLKRSHSALFCYRPTVAQVMGAGSRLVNTKHVIVIQQHWAWVLRTGGNTRHMWAAHRGGHQECAEGGHQGWLGYPCWAGTGSCCCLLCSCGDIKYQTCEKWRRNKCIQELYKFCFWEFISFLVLLLIN